MHGGPIHNGQEYVQWYSTTKNPIFLATIAFKCLVVADDNT